jgi:hypothetical protein
MSPIDLLDSVKDAETFLRFARALEGDRRKSVEERASPSAPLGPAALRWENITIEDVLGQAIAWAKDWRYRETQGLSPSNPWRQFATFLCFGKMYE